MVSILLSPATMQKSWFAIIIIITITQACHSFNLCPSHPPFRLTCSSTKTFHLCPCFPVNCTKDVTASSLCYQCHQYQASQVSEKFILPLADISQVKCRFPIIAHWEIDVIKVCYNYWSIILQKKRCTHVTKSIQCAC